MTERGDYFKINSGRIQIQLKFYYFILILDSAHTQKKILTQMS